MQLVDLSLQFDHAQLSAVREPIEAGEFLCRWVVGVVRKDLKEVSPQNFFALGHRGPQIGLADRDDNQGRRQDEVRPWCGLEQGPEVGARSVGGLVRQWILPLYFGAYWFGTYWEPARRRSCGNRFSPERKHERRSWERRPCGTQPFVHAVLIKQERLVYYVYCAEGPLPICWQSQAPFSKRHPVRSARSNLRAIVVKKPPPPPYIG